MGDEIMFDIKELKFLRKLLTDTKPQDEMVLSLIDKIDNLLKITSSYKECLWSFYWDCGRQGEVEGLFKATKEEVKNAIGKRAYFGEILGKHSEIYGTIEADEIKLVSDNPIEVMNDVESGYNPLEYIQYYCPECGDNCYVDDYDMENGMCKYCSERIMSE